MGPLLLVRPFKLVQGDPEKGTICEVSESLCVQSPKKGNYLRCVTCHRAQRRVTQLRESLFPGPVRIGGDLSFFLSPFL